MKRTLENVSIVEVDAPEDWSDEQIIEAYNVGDLEGTEVDGRIQIEETE